MDEDEDTVLGRTGDMALASRSPWFAGSLLGEWVHLGADRGLAGNFTACLYCGTVTTAHWSSFDLMNEKDGKTSTGRTEV
jgi:hypothetical protein